MSESRDEILADIRTEIELTREEIRLSREERVRSNATFDRCNAALDRNEQASDRNTAAFDRNKDAFDRNTAAFDRNKDASDRNTAAFDRNMALLDHYASESFDLREFTRDLTREFRASMDRLTAGVAKGFEQMREAQQATVTRLDDLLDESRAQRRALLAILDRFERPDAGGATA